MEVKQMYANFSTSSEQYYTVKDLYFSAFLELDIKYPGSPIVFLENPANSAVDLNVGRVIMSLINNCKLIRRRVSVATIPSKGAVVPITNRGGGSNSLAKGLVYNMLNKATPSDAIENGAYVNSYDGYNVPENGCVILKPGQGLIWSCIPTGITDVKISNPICFEVSWWETPKRS